MRGTPKEYHADFYHNNATDIGEKAGTQFAYGAVLFLTTKRNTNMRFLFQHVIIVLLCITMFTVHSTSAFTQVKVDPEETLYRLPAEYEPHDCIWMVWAVESHLDGNLTHFLVMRLIEELEPFVNVKLIVKGEEEREKVARFLREEAIPTHHVSYCVLEEKNKWLRDIGPVFIKNSQGTLKIADFQYNFCGEVDVADPYAQKIGSIDTEIARNLGISTITSNLVSEGGNREVNGRGTMLAVETVALQRNQGKTRDELERELLRTLGQTKMIWLKQGLAEDDKFTRGALPGDIFTASVTGGHIDEFCRFVGPATILLAEVTPEERDADPIYRMSYERLEENYRILSEATDQDGKPFTIIRVPIADHIIKTSMVKQGDFFLTPRGRLIRNDGSMVNAGETFRYVLSTSYLNMLITNGAVIVPSYWKPGRPESIRLKDEKMQRIVQDVFPMRKIIRINPEDLNQGGGGIHCITMQQPAVR